MERNHCFKGDAKIDSTASSIHNRANAGYNAALFLDDVHYLTNRSTGSNYIFYNKDALTRLDGKTAAQSHLAIGITLSKKVLYLQVTADLSLIHI